MKFDELKDLYRKYDLNMGDKDKYLIDGEEREKFINSPANVFVLKSGIVINKAYFKTITPNMEETRDFVSKNRDKIIDEVNNKSLKEQ